MSPSARALFAPSSNLLVFPSNTPPIQRCCDDPLNPPNTCPSATASAWGRPALSRRSAAAVTANTTRSPKPSTGSIRRSSFNAGRHGEHGKRSSWPRCNGWPGSTSSACSNPSAPSLPQKLRQTISGNAPVPSRKRRDLNQTASTNPGAVYDDHRHVDGLDFARQVIARLGDCVLAANAPPSVFEDLFTLALQILGRGVYFHRNRAGAQGPLAATIAQRRFGVIHGIAALWNWRAGWVNTPRKVSIGPGRARRIPGGAAW